MKTINLTKDGFSAMKKLISESHHLSEVLDIRNDDRGGNFFWDWDLKTNRFVHQINLPEDKLELLKFLFEVEIKHFDAHFTTVNNAEKMVKRILKAIK
jgi:hypothetical protein